MKHAIAIAVPMLLVLSACGPTRHIIYDPPAHETHEPFVIAHRGASAYEPEHTIQAYRLALDMGADFLEPDIVFTRDRVAICAHDLTMEQTTDVEQQYPDRARADGSWYWIDFDLAEVRTLNKDGRSRAGTEADNGPYRVVLLAEFFRIARRANGWVGVIPELKEPEFYADNAPEFDPAQALISEIENAPAGPPDLCFIQCFDLDTIEHLATLTDLQLVWLTGSEPTDEQLDRAAAVAHGLGPNRNLLEDDDGNPKPLIDRARSRGLALYPYTFKDEYDTMERFFHVHQVEGIFTDNPDVGILAKNRGAVR